MSLKETMAISGFFLPHSYRTDLKSGAHPPLDNFGPRKARMEIRTCSFHWLQKKKFPGWFNGHDLHPNMYTIEVTTTRPTYNAVSTIIVGNYNKNFGNYQPTHYSASPILTALASKLLGTSDPYASSL